MKRAIQSDTLQWFIGFYLTIRGTLMLMMPHQLSTHIFVPIQPYFPWLGAWQVIAGTVLIASATLLPQRSILVSAHLLAGTALLQAGTGHALATSWRTTIAFVILGIGTAIAPFLPQFRSQNLNSKVIDFFSLLMGIRMTAEGIGFFMPFKEQFAASLYDPVRPYLLLYGLAFLVGGAGLLAVNLYPKAPRQSFQLAHLAAGGVLWSWTASLGFPTWNSVLYFGGLGTLLALLPWLAPHLRRFDPASLQTQLTVTLVGIVTIPLLLTVALVTIPQEQAVLNRSMSVQQTLATIFAENIANYVSLHKAAVVAVASQPGLMTMPALEQEALLAILNKAYPDIAVFATYDATGAAIARSDGKPPGPSMAGLMAYQTMRQTNQSTLEIRMGRVIRQPLFIFNVPIHGADNQFAGTVGGAITSTQIARQLAEAGADINIKAYLVDSRGRAIAHPNSKIVNSFTDLSKLPPVDALLHKNRAGGLQYWDNKKWQLAGYARVPELNWGIVIERPTAEVLATVNDRRTQDFYALSLVVTITLMIASLIARKLTQSLAILADAADELATGNTQAPLPRSRVTEVSHLSTVFGAMRDRLMQQTIEREEILERERQAREAAESANRIKDEFLAVLSHELRSPLNPILGWAKLLRTRKFDAQATDRALEVIERNAKLQTQLIEDLLDVSRILQGKLVLNVAPVDLTTIIEAALETVKLSAEAKGIQIHTVIEPNIGQVAGDSGRLQQILWNFLSNAVKFTPSGGKVEIKLKQFNEIYAQIQVKDNGKGINPEFLPYVFEYFRQADGSTTRQFGGLGLGLAIAKHIAELHGGMVQAESLGEELGATFTVTLPVLKPERRKHDRQGEEIIHFNRRKSSPLSGIKILVVDDEADIRDLVEIILQKSGAVVEVAKSATEALTALEKSKPDILLSDIGMPEMDGYMLMSQVRNHSLDYAEDMKAIALTAYAGEFDQQKALAAGFQMHLSKPIDPQTLVQAIASLVNPNQ